MPSQSRREPGDDGAADQQRQAASELSDRAAESVDRRYDATKEIHHHKRAREGEKREGDEDEDEDRSDEGAA